MKIKNISGLFDEQNVLAKLTRLGDPLVLINEHMILKCSKKRF